MKVKSLRGRKVIDRVRSRGKKWRGRHMSAFYLREKNSGRLFVGASVSKKLHKSAVKRNRMRRRCKEALRTAALANKANVTSDALLLIVPKYSSLTCDFSELCEDAGALMYHLR